MSFILLRKPDVKKKSGESYSGMYLKITEGLWPPPIKISERSSAWIEYEVEAVMAARVLGKSNDEIRSLVCNLVEKRSELNSKIIGALS